jgi:hypothetical protein
MVYGARMLSQFPGRKIRVACEKCPLTAQYDRDAMLASGGDRPLPGLLDEIARRMGCPRMDNPGVNSWDKCQAIYVEISALLKARGEE